MRKIAKNSRFCAFFGRTTTSFFRFLKNRKKLVVVRGFFAIFSRKIAKNRDFSRKSLNFFRDFFLNTKGKNFQVKKLENFCKFWGKRSRGSGKFKLKNLQNFCKIFSPSGCEKLKFKKF